MTRGGHHPIGDDIHRKASHYQSPTDKLNRTHSNSPPGAMQSLAIAPAAGLTLHIRAQCTVLHATQSFQSVKLIFLQRETTEASYCTSYTCYTTRIVLAPIELPECSTPALKFRKCATLRRLQTEAFTGRGESLRVKIGALHP
jgi:hypothetical protein